MPPGCLPLDGFRAEPPGPGADPEVTAGTTYLTWPGNGVAEERDVWNTQMTTTRPGSAEEDGWILSPHTRKEQR